MISLNDKHLKGFVASHELDAIACQVSAAHKMLHDKTGLGNDFLGWVDLPENYDRDEFSRIKAAAEKIKAAQAITKMPVAHDMLFHSLLGFTGMKTSVYRPELDLFSGKTQPHKDPFVEIKGLEQTLPL